MSLRANGGRELGIFDRIDEAGRAAFKKWRMRAATMPRDITRPEPGPEDFFLAGYRAARREIEPWPLEAQAKYDAEDVGLVRSALNNAHADGMLSNHPEAFAALSRLEAVNVRVPSAEGSDAAAAYLQAMLEAITDSPFVEHAKAAARQLAARPLRRLTGEDLEPLRRLVEAFGRRQPLTGDDIDQAETALGLVYSLAGLR